MDEYKTALELIQAVLVDEPDDPNHRFYHCKILSGLERHKEAEAVIKDLILDYPDDAENIALYALILVEQKKFSQVRSLAQRALELDPDQLMAKIAIALADILSGKIKNADGTVQALLAENPGSYAVGWTAGLHLYAKRQYAAALSLFQDLLPHAPNDPDLLDTIVELRIMLHPWCRTFTLLIHYGFFANVMATSLIYGITKAISKYASPTLGLIFGICGTTWLIASWLIPAHLKRKYSRGIN